MIHGGAGEIRDPGRYADSLHRIARSGAHLLENGAPALDAVAHCVAALEDDPLFNAGRGAVLNADGAVYCDASIMDGRSLAAGAAAAVRGVRNPVLLARAILDKSPHVLLVGDGAERFAREQGLAFEENAYFLTEERVGEFAKAKAKREVTLDHMRVRDGQLGTVGAVARDRYGGLAAATSTGGMTNQARGRVGDSPIVGAGVFADNASCAVSCTGVGEHFLRTSLARVAALCVEWRGMDAPLAAGAAIAHLVGKVQGVGGLIIVDRAGVCARAFSTLGMLTATVEKGAIRVEAG
jgi:beta-aspartyl-peptidase (threonine type)